MSNTDSFIEEVTEEVRRDRLFVILRKYAWVGVLAVLLIVGGAALNEYLKAQERTAAQAFGDQLLAGLDIEDGGQTLVNTSVEGPGGVIAPLLGASNALETGEHARATNALNTAATLPDAPQIYRELAQFKLALALSPATPAQDQIAAFDALSEPGAPFRLLAQEQKALIAIQQDDREAAIPQLRAIIEDGDVTPALQRRASELIVALGGTLVDN